MFTELFFEILSFVLQIIILIVLCILYVCFKRDK